MKFTKYCTHSKAWIRNTMIKQTFIITHYFDSGFCFGQMGNYREDIKHKINKDINKLKQ